jgi:predicted RNA-binding Zn ribbon-like protein
MAIVEADDPPGAALAWADVDAQTTDLFFQYTFAAAGQAGLRQVSGDPIVGGVIRAVTDLLAANQWSRICACANDLCSHVFYDATRSRTQRWDSYETCGNRINVAAHRARSRPTRAAG